MNAGLEGGLASAVLVLFLALLFAYDWITTRGHRRLLVVEGLVFFVGGILVVRPSLATALAHTVGIGRGVDFVLYPIVIWLVRDSLRWRRLRHADQERFTALVRALAEKGAVPRGVDAGDQSFGSPPQAPSPPASRSE